MIMKEMRHRHSAIYDTEMLLNICQKGMDLLPTPNHPYVFPFNDILLHLNEKLSTAIWVIFNLARECSSQRTRI